MLSRQCNARNVRDGYTKSAQGESRTYLSLAHKPQHRFLDESQIPHTFLCMVCTLGADEIVVSTNEQAELEADLHSLAVIR